MKIRYKLKNYPDKILHTKYKHSNSLVQYYLDVEFRKRTDNTMIYKTIKFKDGEGEDNDKA